VKYLIYSHNHADHSAGGEAFADTAVVIAHENAKRTIVAEQRPTAIPQVTFSDEMTIELGGKTVELAYLGRSHSDNMIVMRFPEARALYTVDFISVKRLPYMTLSDAYFPDWIDAVKNTAPCWRRPAPGRAWSRCRRASPLRPTGTGASTRSGGRSTSRACTGRSACTAGATDSKGRRRRFGGILTYP
jgi:hypothetical protein